MLDAGPSKAYIPRWTPEDDLRLYELATNIALSGAKWQQVRIQYNQNKEQEPREESVLCDRFNYLHHRKGETIESLKKKVEQAADAPKGERKGA